MFKKFNQFCSNIQQKLADRDMPVAGKLAAIALGGLPFGLFFGACLAGSAVLLGGVGAIGIVVATAMPYVLTVAGGFAGAAVVAAGVETSVASVQKSVTRGTRNEAGQTIVGSVYDLKRLAKAQAEITAISSTFNGAAADREQQIANVIAMVEPLRTKVQVFDAGSLHASNDKYDFKI